jgi:hypothetical protein
MADVVVELVAAFHLILNETLRQLVKCVKNDLCKDFIVSEQGIDKRYDHYYNGDHGCDGDAQGYERERPILFVNLVLGPSTQILEDLENGCCPFYSMK